jgi:tRNA uridine 5-carboxymethylaminomethyl modification enzyme
MGYNIGLASNERKVIFQKKTDEKSQVINFLKNYSIDPKTINTFLIDSGTSSIIQKVKLIDLAKRPQINLIALSKFVSDFSALINTFITDIDELLERAEIDIKYDGYIDRERQLAEKIKRLENIRILESIDFNLLKSISTEGRQKLSKIRPATVGQASRISGVSPSDISVLLVYMGR